ncbi:hypothetical protein THAOC_05495 [Thalassiosira oceanica]|uniref:Uncharacterized protein n=1 Tax=Thalassiosira oceanica TaxID=159749 RepID=K0T5I6_THAOC|nr:hypothetical protein THAOC_05495 [Thalassiosira oceanica]|eukprot:EJK72925.1 hypothetical protein THAOC_05495 [Thalassiosira oceanica]
MTSWRGFHFDAYLENHSGYDDESPLLKLRCIVYGDAYSPYCWMISGSNVLTTSAWRGAGQLLARNPSIKRFELDSNEISQESFRVFMTALEGNTTIVNFTICENSRVGTNEGSRVLSAFLLRRKCPMVSLHLDALGISLSSFQILSPGIGRPGLCGRRVEELRLTGNDLSANTEEKRATLYHSLTNLSWLKTLDLEGCKLGNSG